MTGDRQEGPDDHDQEVERLKLPERLVLTVSEAAAILGISRSHAYDLVARRVLPSRRLGRRIVIPRDALLRFLDGPAEPAA
jgi:excisionase family DNA binding protein